VAGDQIHLGIKLAYTLFLLVLVPVYWAHYGPKNFRWFSDIALLTTGATLWLESPLLASMMMLAVLLPELAWNLDFFGRLLTGHTMFGMSAYMFDARTPRYLRALSLFHVPLPAGLDDPRRLVHHPSADPRIENRQLKNENCKLAH